MIVTEKPFRQVLVTALKKLVLKLVSFKNLIAILAIILGVVVISLPHINATFKDWGDYMFRVLVLFFASNQVQKWIFARFNIKDDRPNDLYDVTEEPGSECEEGDYGDEG